MFSARAQVLEVLWELAHLPTLPTSLVQQALEEHLGILSDAYAVKEAVKRNYIIKCIEDIKKVSRPTTTPPPHSDSVAALRGETLSFLEKETSRVFRLLTFCWLARHVASVPGLLASYWGDDNLVAPADKSQFPLISAAIATQSGNNSEKFMNGWFQSFPQRLVLVLFSLWLAHSFFKKYYLFIFDFASIFISPSPVYLNLYKFIYVK